MYALIDIKDQDVPSSGASTFYCEIRILRSQTVYFFSCFILICRVVLDSYIQSCPTWEILRMLNRIKARPIFAWIEATTTLHQNHWHRPNSPIYSGIVNGRKAMSLIPKFRTPEIFWLKVGDLKFSPAQWNNNEKKRMFDSGILEKERQNSKLK